LTSKYDESARAQLIRTRRGTWIDKSLFPEVRRECLEILRKVARDSEGKGIVEMLRGEREHLNDYPLGDLLRSLRSAPSSWEWLDRDRLNWAGLVLFSEKLYEYRTPEEREAWILVTKAREFVNVCGCCGRELTSQEPVYFGAKIYVGMWPLRWNMVAKPRHICEPQYERTVLCGSCAPEWLSQERNDVVTQLCAHCERPMILRLRLSELRNMFCSARCQRAYHRQLQEDKKAEATEKAREKRAEELEKVCEVCGEEFTATRRDAKACSKACKQKAYRRRKKGS